MLPLKVTVGGLFTGLAVVCALAFVFYLIGRKKSGDNRNPKYLPPLKPNPNTPKAKKAFLDNLPKFMPYFSGVSEIIVDRDGMSDAVVDLNDDDLIALWNQTKDNPKMWINQMAAFGVSADSRTEFVAMNKHKEMYSLEGGGEIQEGIRYKVLSACWIQTLSELEKTVKKVVKKGIVKEVEE